MWIVVGSKGFLVSCFLCVEKSCGVVGSIDSAAADVSALITEHLSGCNPALYVAEQRVALRFKEI